MDDEGIQDGGRVDRHALRMMQQHTDDKTEDKQNEVDHLGILTKQIQANPSNSRFCR